MNNRNITTVQIHHQKKRPVTSSSDSEDEETDDARAKSKTKKHRTFTRPTINVLSNALLQTPITQSPTLGSCHKTMDESQKQDPGSQSSSRLNSSTRISSQDFLINHNNQGSILSLKFELTEINSRLETIENLLRVRNAVGASESFATNNFCINHLPARTVDELDALNIEIMNQPEHLHELLNFLYLLGGDNVQKTIYLIMSKIFHKELAVLYSGQGRKKKLDFSRMKLYEVVMEATRKRHKNATTEEMKKAIGLYLAAAKARLRN